MTAYELFIEDTFCGEQHTNTLLFDTREKAIAKLKELRDDFAKENDLTDYNIDMDTEDEFDCYEQGFYNSNRFVVYIVESEVN